MTNNLYHIQTLFHKIYKEPFPTEGGKEVLGVELVLIDSDIIGVASHLFNNKGELRTKYVLRNDQIELLRKSNADLNKIMPLLNSNERSYFHSLKELATEILQNIQE